MFVFFLYFVLFHLLGIFIYLFNLLQQRKFFCNVIQVVLDVTSFERIIRKDVCVSPFASLPACARLSLPLLLPDAEVWHPDTRSLPLSFVSLWRLSLISTLISSLSVFFSAPVSASTVFFSWSHSASKDSSWIRRNSSATSFFALHLSFALPNPAIKFGCMQFRTGFVCYRSSRPV